MFKILLFFWWCCTLQDLYIIFCSVLCHIYVIHRLLRFPLIIPCSVLIWAYLLTFIIHGYLSAIRMSKKSSMVFYLICKYMFPYMICVSILIFTLIYIEIQTFSLLGYGFQRCLITEDNKRQIIVCNDDWIQHDNLLWST